MAPRAGLLSAGWPRAQHPMFSDAGIGIFANSACLIADGWHSFGDLCSDVLCWTCHKVGARPPDASHPNGYVRYEHIGTLAIAAMLASSGAHQPPPHP